MKSAADKELEKRREASEVTEPAPSDEPDKTELRGKLLEQVKSRAERDTQELSKLRGTLLEKRAEADASEPSPDIEPFPRELRGKLLERTKDTEPGELEEPSKLRGPLVERRKDSAEPYSQEWLQAQTFIQRDSGHGFKVEQIFNDGYGDKVRLKSPTDGRTVVLGLDRFIERLQIPGEAWSVEEP